MTDNPVVIGIDLGSEKIVISKWEGVTPNFLKPSIESHFLGSVTYTTSFQFNEKSILDNELKFPERVIHHVCQWLGNRKPSIIKGKECVNGYFDCEHFGEVSIEVILSMMIKSYLEELKIDKIDHMVISVPYTFGFLERKQINEAMSLIGFNDVVIIGEDVASSVSYLFNRYCITQLEIKGFIKPLVLLDVGSSHTFCQLCIFDGNEILLVSRRSIEVGGQNIDEKLRALIMHKIKELDDDVKEFMEENGDDEKKMKRLESKVQQSLIKLKTLFCNSVVNEGTLKIDLSSEVTADVEVTREDMNNVMSEILKETKGVIEEVIKEGIEECNDKMKSMNIENKIQEVCIIGSSGRISLYRTLIESIGLTPLMVLDNETCNSCGACCVAKKLSISSEDIENYQRDTNTEASQKVHSIKFFYISRLIEKGEFQINGQEYPENSILVTLGGFPTITKITSQNLEIKYKNEVILSKENYPWDSATIKLDQFYYNGHENYECKKEKILSNENHFQKVKLSNSTPLGYFIIDEGLTIPLKFEQDDVLEKIHENFDKTTKKNDSIKEADKEKKDIKILILQLKKQRNKELNQIIKESENQIKNIVDDLELLREIKKKLESYKTSTN
ncbi:endoplasmic reticulum family HSP70 protein, putative [Entamoeba histolytica HM-3:IMSS]|uniref:Endoplasmic reticulum family HSP70 protein, putative n=1 Tax=Entamoeba histolytica HM-3:IMSS TaxID=885315 RepID=M7X1S9_ENTHI|nr:endoplasmic reticulum family HSP70 protein, putative [Entamoeba histolytica HM-3:IMSS]